MSSCFCWMACSWCRSLSFATCNSGRLSYAWPSRVSASVTHSLLYILMDEEYIDLHLIDLACQGTTGRDCLQDFVVLALAKSLAEGPATPSSPCAPFSMCQNLSNFLEASSTFSVETWSAGLREGSDSRQ